MIDDRQSGRRAIPAPRRGRVSRRSVLAGGAAASVLVALPDTLTAASAQAATGAAGATGATGAAGAAPAPTPATPGHFFLYGTTGAAAAPALHGWRAQGPRGAARPTPLVVGAELAARPARSTDGATVAFPTVGTAPSGATVTLTLVDAATAAVQTTASLRLPGVPQDSSILVRPVFAPGTATVAVVIAVSVPTQWQTFRKASANGSNLVTPTATWTTHHVLAYLDRRTGSFSEPFHLGNAPSLAWTDAVADAENLYLWTMREPAVSVGTKQNPLPAPPPHVLTFPLGSGRPTRTARSAGAWPNGATGLVLATGDIARLADGRDLEVYSARTGVSARRKFAEFGSEVARAGATTLHPRPDGTLVVANAAFGRAVVVDPAGAFRTVARVDYGRPRIALGGPDAKTALSPDGRVLYTLGAAGTGGLSAHDLATGELVAAHTDGAHYSGVYQLPSGTLLAVTGTDTGSELRFFSPTLTGLGASGTDMFVAEVF